MIRLFLGVALATGPWETGPSQYTDPVQPPLSSGAIHELVSRIPQRCDRWRSLEAHTRAIARRRAGTPPSGVAVGPAPATAHRSASARAGSAAHAPPGPVWSS